MGNEKDDDPIGRHVASGTIFVLFVFCKGQIIGHESRASNFENETVFYVPLYKCTI